MTSFSHSFGLKFAGVLALGISVVGCDPGDGSDDFAAAREAAAQGNYPLAVSHYEKGLLEAPRDVVARLEMATLALRQGDIERADEQLDLAGVDAAEDADLLELQAQVAWYKKEYAKAALLYGRLADDVKRSNEVRARAWSGLGVIASATGDAATRVAKSRTAFMRARLLNGRDAAACYNLGYLYRDIGYREAARDLFEVFVYLEKNDKSANGKVSPKAARTESRVLTSLKEEIRKSELTRPGMARRDSAKSASELKRAEKLMASKRVTDAIKAYQSAYAADQTSYTAALALAQAWEKAPAANAEKRTANEREAYKAYYAASQLRPSAVATLLSAGRLAMKLGNTLSAESIYSRVLAMNPINITALDGLIQAMQRNGHDDTASVYKVYKDWINKHHG